MEFIFTDKCKVEMNIIVDVLYEEKIPYKLEKFTVKDFFFDEDDAPDFVIIEEMYNIHCFTDLEHFDFVKHISYKKIKDRMKLERCYLKKVRKNVQRIYKKNITNTNSNGRNER